MPADAEGRRSDRWRVRHEGLAARGKGISDLPATLRVVNESACEGCDVLGFWRALGFEHAYSMIKEGSLYRFCFSLEDACLNIFPSSAFSIDHQHAEA